MNNLISASPKRYNHLYIAKAWSYSWKIIIILVLIKTILLLLFTHVFSISTISDTYYTGDTERLSAIFGLTGPFLIALGGYIFAKRLPSDWIKNACMMGSIIGMASGIGSTLFLTAFMLAIPANKVNTSFNAQMSMLLFIPKNILYGGVFGTIGGIFAFPKRKKL